MVVAFQPEVDQKRGVLVKVKVKRLLSCKSPAESLYAVECSGPVFKVNQNFSFSVFGFLNISFEPEFGNPNLETRVLKPHIQFCFSAIADFILWFCTSLSSETWSFKIAF